MLRRFVFILFLLSVFCTIKAYKYTGRVFDKLSGEPLPFTHIYDSMGNLVTLSDEQGFFNIDNHEADSVRVTASSIGYQRYYMAFARESKLLLVALAPAGQELEDVVVEGMKSFINTKLPYTQSTVFAANIEEKVSSSLIDVLETVPGVYKKSEYHSPIVLRGLTGKRILITQDGNRKMGGTSAGFTGQTVNVYNLDKVEVIKGPASVKYGPGAIGGIINMVSRSINQQEGLQGKMLSTYGTNNHEYIVLGNINYSSGIHSISVGGKYQNASNYHYGKKQVAENSYHRSGDMNILYLLQPKPDLQLSINGNLHLGGPWGRAKGYNGTDYVLQRAEKDDSYGVTVAGYWDCGKTLSRLEGSLYFNKDDLEEHRNDYDIGSGRLSYSEIVRYNNYYSGWRLHALFQLRKKWNITVGSDGVYYRVKSPTTLIDHFKNYTINNKVSDDAGVGMGGVFAESELSTTNNKLKWLVGLRADLAHINEGEVHDTAMVNGRGKNYSIFNINTGLMLQVAEGTSLTMNMARASRMPDAKELFMESATTDGSVFGNLNLKPESGLNFDLGLKGILGNVVFDVSMFSNFIHNFIIQKIWSGSGRRGINYRFDNIDKSLIYGLEASVAYHKDGVFGSRDLLNYNAFAVYTKGYEIAAKGGWFSKNKIPLNQIAPFNMRHELIYRYRLGGRASIYAGANVLWFSARTDYAPTSYPTSSYCLLGCLFGAQKAFQTTKWKLSVNMTNLTNEGYKPFESLVYGMGRNIKILLSVEFGGSRTPKRADCINL